MRARFDVVEKMQIITNCYFNIGRDNTRRSYELSGEDNIIAKH